MPDEVIRIQGARQHNLKNLNVEIPRNKLVVITGVSGSGKSSLAFNTLYAEGQRRYVESLSAYARQFLDQLEKPDVDFIEGLSPAIAIEQRGSSPNPRSTIATTTEIYDYLRILFAAVGTPHDPKTGAPLSRSTTADIIAEIISLPEKTRLMILAPVSPGEGEGFHELASRLKKQGFLRLRLDGEILELDQPLDEALNPSTIEIVVDRLVIREDIRSRVADSVETTLRISGSQVLVLIQNEQREWDETIYVTTYTNPETGFTLPALTPKHFSFNSHLGACPKCHGLGSQLEPDPTLFVPDPDKSIDGGGIKTWWTGSKKRKGYHQRLITALAAHFGHGTDEPIRSLSREFKRALFYGTTDKVSSELGNKPFEGLSVGAMRLLQESKSEVTKRNVRRFMSMRPCEACEGRRLKPAILAVTLAHKEDPRSIEGFTRLSVEGAT